MNKYEEALDWLTLRCMEPNDDYEGLVYDKVPDFEIEANIEPLRELIEKATPKNLQKQMCLKRTVIVHGFALHVDALTLITIH